MFSQFFVQIFALYKFFRKNLRKKRRKFSMDPICLHQVFQTISEKMLEVAMRKPGTSNARSGGTKRIYLKIASRLLKSHIDMIHMTDSADL